MYAYSYECRRHTTPPITSKVQRRQRSVVRQTLRQSPSSLIADAVACTAHAQEATVWVNCSPGVWEYRYLNADGQTPVVRGETGR